MHGAGDPASTNPVAPRGFPVVRRGAARLTGTGEHTCGRPTPPLSRTAPAYMEITEAGPRIAHRQGHCRVAARFPPCLMRQPCGKIQMYGATNCHSSPSCRNGTAVARLAELVDALGLGPSAERCGGSSPSTGTTDRSALGPSLNIGAIINRRLRLGRILPIIELTTARCSNGRSNDRTAGGY